jgi:hypothetical protein
VMTAGLQARDKLSAARKCSVNLDITGYWPAE